MDSPIHTMKYSVWPIHLGYFMHPDSFRLCQLEHTHTHTVDTLLESMRHKCERSVKNNLGSIVQNAYRTADWTHFKCGDAKS